MKSKLIHSISILFLLLILFPSQKVHSQDILQINDLTGKKGGTLVLALLSDPRTFNPLIATTDQASATVTAMMFDGLTQVNAMTQEAEPTIAKNWEVSKDGKEWIFHLRKGIKWSDGMPVTADDVIFTFEAIYRPDVETPSKDILQINEQPLKATKIDQYTVKITLPEIYAPFLRQIEKSTVPILPKHKWEKTLKDGNFTTAMGLNSEPSDIVVSGPYMLEKYIPGQRVILKANPHYYKYDKNKVQLPYLDKIIINIITDINSIYLKLLSGELDIWDGLRPEDYSMLKENEAKAKKAQIAVEKLGISPAPEMMWFNLNKDLNPKTKKPFMEAKKFNWFSNPLFRQAIAHAIDRETIIRNIYYGAAKPTYGFETESNTVWNNSSLPPYDYSIEKAKALLKKAGFTIKQTGRDKVTLFDAKGNEVKFTIVTNTKNAGRASAVNLIASDLKKIGMNVNVQLLEFQNLVVKLSETFDYDAVVFSLTRPDFDPSVAMNILLSSSGMHLWHPNQEKPATDWEAKIDELMNLQIKTYDQKLRKKYYDEVQKILHEQIPVIYLYSPLAISAYKTTLSNLKCAVVEPRCIWNIGELSLK